MRGFLLTTLTILMAMGVMSQESEGSAKSWARDVEFYLPTENLSNLFKGPRRFIRLGIKGDNEIREALVQSFSRYILRDNLMFNAVEPSDTTSKNIVYYFFYLSDLADANDFQKMLLMYEINEVGGASGDISTTEFSSKVYSYEKNEK